MMFGTISLEIKCPSVIFNVAKKTYTFYVRIFFLDDYKNVFIHISNKQQKFQSVVHKFVMLYDRNMMSQ